MRSRLLILLFVLAGIAAPAQMQKTASVEGITEYQLDNGLKVLLFPDNSSQTITVNMTYLVGSRHEGYGEKGMAHLLEHMVFKGTPDHPDIPKELSNHGARPNGTRDGHAASHARHWRQNCMTSAKASYWVRLTCTCSDLIPSLRSGRSLSLARR